MRLNFFFLKFEKGKFFFKILRGTFAPKLYVNPLVESQFKFNGGNKSMIEYLDIFRGKSI